MHLAGFSSAEAEGLRRAMSRRRSEEALRAHHDHFLAGAVERGVPAPVAERVWGQIQGFSGFGFPKAHSAAFGLLAYQSAWLRIHYAPEFLCSLLNEQPMGFYPPDALVGEAQRRGVRLAGPDANRSRVLCHVESPLSRRRAEKPTMSGSSGPSAGGGDVRGGLAVRIGLGYVKGTREEEMESLVAERERGGPYRDMADLASRCGGGRDGLERLAWAGALDALIALPADGPKNQPCLDLPAHRRGRGGRRFGRSAGPAPASGARPAPRWRCRCRRPARRGWLPWGGGRGRSPTTARPG